MAYDGVLEDVRTCLAGGKPSQVPVFAMSQVFDAVSAGYTFEQLESDEKKLIQSVIRGIERFDWDWGWAPIGDSVTFEPLGFDFGPKRGGQGNNPYIVISHRPPTRATLKTMRLIDPEVEGRMPFHLNAIRALNDRFGDQICTVGWVVGPLQCVAYLYGVSNTFLLVYDDPVLLRDTLNLFAEQAKLIVDAEVAAGADAIFIPDLLCASYFISIRQYRDLVFPVHRKLFSYVQRKGVPVFFHPNEPRVEHLRAMAKLGEVCNLAITVGSEGDIVLVREELGDTVCLMGNVHCLHTLRDGSIETVRAEVRRIVREVSLRGGHIFNTCATMSFDTPAENALAMVKEARRQFRQS